MAQITDTLKMVALSATVDPLDQFLNASTLTHPSPRGEAEFPAQAGIFFLNVLVRTCHKVIMLMLLDPLV
jgi:hypothetical protein